MAITIINTITTMTDITYDHNDHNYYYYYINDYNNNHATVVLQLDYSGNSNYHDIRIKIGNDFDVTVDFSRQA